MASYPYTKPGFMAALAEHALSSQVIRVKLYLANAEETIRSRRTRVDLHDGIGMRAWRDIGGEGPFTLAMLRELPD